MRKEIITLVEAVRHLSIELSPTNDNINGIKITCSRSDFPVRLACLRRALDAYDASTAVSNDNKVNDEVVSLKMALDAVFRWMRSQNMDITEPHSVVATALRKKNTQANGNPKLVPNYAPNGVKKGKKPKPLLKLMPDIGEKVTLDNLRKKNFQADATLNSLGNAAPR